MHSPSPYVISYFTDDLASNRRFYGDVVGLPIHSDLPDIYFLAGAGGWKKTVIVIPMGGSSWYSCSIPPIRSTTETMTGPLSRHVGKRP
jgi:catechol 2,3-dioxygenase-like lactoylglutathione lyase family enzyme